MLASAGEKIRSFVFLRRQELFLRFLPRAKLQGSPRCKEEEQDRVGVVNGHVAGHNGHSGQLSHQGQQRLRLPGPAKALLLFLAGIHAARLMSPAPQRHAPGMKLTPLAQRDPAHADLGNTGRRSFPEEGHDRGGALQRPARSKGDEGTGGRTPGGETPLNSISNGTGASTSEEGQDSSADRGQGTDPRIRGSSGGVSEEGQPLGTSSTHPVAEATVAGETVADATVPAAKKARSRWRAALNMQEVVASKSQLASGVTAGTPLEGTGGGAQAGEGTSAGTPGATADATVGATAGHRRGRLGKLLGGLVGRGARRNRTAVARRKKVVIPEVDAPYPNFVILYRILGNDLPPLHEIGQTRWNLEYILRHEPAMEGCEKRWVLNRIANSTEKLFILLSLRSSGVRKRQILDIPMDLDQLANRPAPAVDPASVKLPMGVGSTLPPFLGNSDSLAQYVAKARDFIGLNQARNVAVSDARRAGARWAWVLDGSQFVPELTWRTVLHSSVTKKRSLRIKYIQVQGVRATRKQSPSWLNASSSVEDLVWGGYAKLDEPQVLLRNDSTAAFNPGVPYSLGAKQALLEEVCSGKSKMCKCNDKVSWSKVVSLRKVRDRVALCGATVRLWPYPSSGFTAGQLRTRKAKVLAVKKFLDSVDREVSRRRLALQEQMKRSFAVEEESFLSALPQRTRSRRRIRRKRKRKVVVL